MTTNLTGGNAFLPPPPPPLHFGSGGGNPVSTNMNNHWNNYGPQQPTTPFFNGPHAQSPIPFGPGGGGGAPPSGPGGPNFPTGNPLTSTGLQQLLSNPALMTALMQNMNPQQTGGMQMPPNVGGQPPFAPHHQHQSMSQPQTPIMGNGPPLISPPPQQPMPMSVHQHHQQHHNARSSSASDSNTRSSSPTFPSTCVTPSPPAGALPNETRGGIGVLTWLSSKAGLIQCDGNLGTVSFQLKDFCDQAVGDLTSCLRPGFTLKFQALSSGSRDWIATFVSPVHGQEANIQFVNEGEIDLEAPVGRETGPPQMPKDPYLMELELRAVPMLLSIFERQGLPQCQLSSFHCQISNCGDDDLYRYVGTSSLKRRQFLERRTHMFHISSNDLVTLQPAEIYATVMVLVHRLLTRGGACLMQELFDHFNSCPEIPLEARELIGDGKSNFLRFLEEHKWIFTVFPSRVFVAIRRNLPVYDYAGFLNEHFADCDLRQYSPLNQTRSGGGGGGGGMGSMPPPPAPRPMPMGMGNRPPSMMPPPPNRQQPPPPVPSGGGGGQHHYDPTGTGGWGHHDPKDPAPPSRYDQSAYGTGGGAINGYDAGNIRQPPTPGWGAPTPIEDINHQYGQGAQGGASFWTPSGPQGRHPPSMPRGGHPPMRHHPPPNSLAINGSNGIGGGVDMGESSRVGGRIKRFTDTAMQTDTMTVALGGGGGGQKASTVDTGCNPDDATIAVREPSERGFISATANQPPATSLANAADLGGGFGDLPGVNSIWAFNHPFLGFDLGKQLSDMRFPSAASSSGPGSAAGPSTGSDDGAQL